MLERVIAREIESDRYKERKSNRMKKKLKRIRKEEPKYFDILEV